MSDSLAIKLIANYILFQPLNINLIDKFKRFLEYTKDLDVNDLGDNSYKFDIIDINIWTEPWTKNISNKFEHFQKYINCLNVNQIKDNIYLSNLSYSNLRLSKHPILFLVKLEMLRQQIKGYILYICSNDCLELKYCLNCGYTVSYKFYNRTIYKCAKCIDCSYCKREPYQPYCKGCGIGVM